MGRGLNEDLLTTTRSGSPEETAPFEILEESRLRSAFASFAAENSLEGGISYQEREKINTLLLASNLPQRALSPLELRYLNFELFRVVPELVDSDMIAALNVDYRKRRDSLPRRAKGRFSDTPFSSEEVLALYRLELALPLLEMDTQSMNSFREILLKNNPQGIFKNALLSPDSKNLHTTAQFIELIALSAEDSYVEEVENIVRQQFEKAQELSEVQQRRVEHLLPVISEEYAWFLFPNERNHSCFVGGFNTSFIQGSEGQELGVIVASKSAHENSGQSLEDFVLYNTVHEMIHDTQGSQMSEIMKSTYQNDRNGWNQYAKHQLLEGLTDTLAALRLEHEGGPGYRANREAVCNLLVDAGVEESDFEDRLHYLNSLPLDFAIDVLQDWLGKDFQDDFLTYLDSA